MISLGSKEIKDYLKESTMMPSNIMKEL